MTESELVKQIDAPHRGTNLKAGSSENSACNSQPGGRSRSNAIIQPTLLLENDLYAAILLTSLRIIGPVRLFVRSNGFLRAKTLDGKLGVAQAFLLG